MPINPLTLRAYLKDYEDMLVLINNIEGSKEILEELENMNIKTKSQLDNREDA